MSLAPRILAAAGLLAVPALLAVGSQALSRPAEVPLRERQTVVVDLAPAGTTDPAPAGADGDPAGADGDPAEPSPAEPSTSPERIPEPASGTPAPVVPAPVVPAPLAPADQGTPGLVERGILGDTDDDGRDDASDDASDDADSDDDSAVPDGED